MQSAAGSILQPLDSILPEYLFSVDILFIIFCVLCVSFELSVDIYQLDRDIHFFPGSLFIPSTVIC